ncbi:hypothetical protein E2C01_056150 [Portunus trituberculatus]|uniref:Uncharacterized protein n=1 Tax=Portunus trituberculatus TaxID=210409 RepID=A0A5B7GPM1_PORTR|nr:hypothetical protein [Portunus trituberculatus]
MRRGGRLPIPDLPRPSRGTASCRLADTELGHHQAWLTVVKPDQTVLSFTKLRYLWPGSLKLARL